MKNIAIFGAGGFGREVACHIRRINEKKATWKMIGFFDDSVTEGTPVSHYGSILGGIAALNRWDEDLDVVLAIGDERIRRKIFQKINNPNIHYPNIIVPGIRFNDVETFHIGMGNIINSDCAFSCDVALGDFNIFNGSVVLGHDVSVGSFNTFMPAVRISGCVIIEEDNFFGVGSIVLQNINIGKNVRLSAGSVMIRNPKDGFLYVGNPAKKMMNV